MSKKRKLDKSTLLDNVILYLPPGNYSRTTYVVESDDELHVLFDTKETSSLDIYSLDSNGRYKYVQSGSSTITLDGLTPTEQYAWNPSGGSYYHFFNAIIGRTDNGPFIFGHVDAVKKDFIVDFTKKESNFIDSTGSGGFIHNTFAKIANNTFLYATKYDATHFALRKMTITDSSGALSITEEASVQQEYVGCTAMESTCIQTEDGSFGKLIICGLYTNSNNAIYELNLYLFSSSDLAFKKNQNFIIFDGDTNTETYHNYNFLRLWPIEEYKSILIRNRYYSGFSVKVMIFTPDEYQEIFSNDTIPNGGSMNFFCNEMEGVQLAKNKYFVGSFGDTVIKGWLFFLYSNYTKLKVRYYMTNYTENTRANVDTLTVGFYKGLPVYSFTFFYKDTKITDGGIAVISYPNGTDFAKTEDIFKSEFDFKDYIKIENNMLGLLIEKIKLIDKPEEITFVDSITKEVYTDEIPWSEGKKLLIGYDGQKVSKEASSISLTIKYIVCAYIPEDVLKIDTNLLYETFSAPDNFNESELYSEIQQTYEGRLNYFNLTISNPSSNKCFSSCNFCKEEGTELMNSKCLVCADGYHFINGTDNCIDDSITGYYLDPETDKYYPCHSNCVTCLGEPSEESNACQTCIEGLHLVTDNANCLESLSGYYIDESTGNLLRCDLSCKECTGNSKEDHMCSSCADGLYKVEGQGNCVESLSGYYLDESTGTLKKCHASCANCTGGSEEDCSSCAEGYYLLEEDKKCYSELPGYYIDTETGTLKQCDFGCTSCEEASKCLYCDSSKYFNTTPSNDKCVCMDKYTFDESTSECFFAGKEGEEEPTREDTALKMEVTKVYEYSKPDNNTLSFMLETLMVGNSMNDLKGSQFIIYLDDSNSQTGKTPAICKILEDNPFIEVYKKMDIYYVYYNCTAKTEETSAKIVGTNDNVMINFKDGQDSVDPSKSQTHDEILNYRKEQVGNIAIIKLEFISGEYNNNTVLFDVYYKPEENKRLRLRFLDKILRLTVSDEVKNAQEFYLNDGEIYCKRKNDSENIFTCTLSDDNETEKLVINPTNDGNENIIYIFKQEGEKVQLLSVKQIKEESNSSGGSSESSNESTESSNESNESSKSNKSRGGGGDSSSVPAGLIVGLIIVAVIILALIIGGIILIKKQLGKNQNGEKDNTSNSKENLPGKNYGENNLDG